MTEASVKGQGFLADVCSSWEQSTAKPVRIGVRHVIIRSGILSGRNADEFYLGGMADEFLLSSQCVIPERLEKEGVEFDFADLLRTENAN